LAALLAGYLECVRLLLGVPFTPLGFIERWVWLLAVLILASWARPWSNRGSLWCFSSRLWPLLGGGLVSLAWYFLTLSTLSAWVVSGLFYALVLVSAGGIGASTGDSPAPRRYLWRGIGWGGLAVLGGLLPVALQGVESRFAEEEFFAALAVIVLILFTLLLMGLHLWLKGRQVGTAGQTDTSPPGLCLDFRLVLGTLALILVAALGGLIYAYQHSFYAPQAPAFEGVTTSSPFLCGVLGSTAVKDGALDGETVFDRLRARVESNPNKASPEYGMLALMTGEMPWAEAFRDALLAEAGEGRYTDPAHSVKFAQYQAALRVYYLLRMRDAFPGLFSEGDWSLIHDWLGAINRRSLSVEWVDWMYGLAFSKRPEGPYENQENGAGLLALLEVLGATPEDLSGRNRDYLARNQRGWFQRFRNTDDAFIYQPEWINNALFQALFWGDGDQDFHIAEQNRRLSFEWLLLQALPDGAAMGYNHPVRTPLATVAYLGAGLLQDPRYLWLSERSLDALEAEGQHLTAQPAVEAPVELLGKAPSQGSCLLFGDSGLPNQQGPLAPDKIVFRSGWLPESAYLLLNLRFTGWHRYKATNSIVLLFQEGPLVLESASGTSFSWLPVGRSLFRDKRIPRTNLNGLLIPRSGMSRVLYELIGFGGSLWAQDPPHYAGVERFETLGPLDFSRTVLDDWRGWDHARSIYFFHDGPIVVMDAAENERDSGPAALTWHVVGQGLRDNGGLWLRTGDSPARLALTSGDWDTTELTASPQAGAIDWTPDWDMVYHSPQPGRLGLSTTFLLDDWADASFETTTLWDKTDEDLNGQYAHIKGAPGEIELLHNESGASLERDGLSTDGQSLIKIDLRGDEGTRICYVGGQDIRVQLPEPPAEVLALSHGDASRSQVEGPDSAGQALVRGDDWDWMDAELVIYGDARDAKCVRVIPR
jgi:hypothetical protein